MNYTTRGVSLLDTAREMIEQEENEPREIDTTIVFRLPEKKVIPTDDLVLKENFLDFTRIILGYRGKADLIANESNCCVFKSKGELFRLKAIIKYPEGEQEVHFHFRLSEEKIKEIELFNKMTGNNELIKIVFTPKIEYAIRAYSDASNDFLRKKSQLIEEVA